MSQKAPKRPGKSPTKSAPAKRVPKHGHGALFVGGKPGNKGGGRKPDEFKQLCRALASGDMTVEQVGAILTNRDHPQFMAALKWATENGYGKPKESVELTGKDGGPIQQVWRFGDREVVF